MVKKHYDTFIIGHISKDEIVYKGMTSRMLGGAVIYSSHAAVAGGYRTGVLTKTAGDRHEAASLFSVDEEDIFHIPCGETTSIRNEYLTPDRERRICTALCVAERFRVEDMPDISSQIFHLAGLIAGDFQTDLITHLSRRGKVAVDVQGFLRHNEGGKMFFKDWQQKEEYLPFIHFLKTDAAEAEVMTGEKDRKKAAEVLHGWGAREIMITHNTEVIVYNGRELYSFPLKPRNLSGRTGRGDTCFSAYITERLKNNPDAALQYAAALVSLKMETPGPFKGNRDDVEKYLHNFY